MLRPNSWAFSRPGRRARSGDSQDASERRGTHDGLGPDGRQTQAARGKAVCPSAGDPAATESGALVNGDLARAQETASGALIGSIV